MGSPQMPQLDWVALMRARSRSRCAVLRPGWWWYLLTVGLGCRGSRSRMRVLRSRMCTRCRRVGMRADPWGSCRGLAFDGEYAGGDGVLSVECSLDCSVVSVFEVEGSVPVDDVG